MEFIPSLAGLQLNMKVAVYSRINPPQNKGETFFGNRKKEKKLPIYLIFILHFSSENRSHYREETCHAENNHVYVIILISPNAKNQADPKMPQIFRAFLSIDASIFKHNLFVFRVQEGITGVYLQWSVDESQGTLWTGLSTSDRHTH